MESTSPIPQDVELQNDQERNDELSVDNDHKDEEDLEIVQQTPAQSAPQGTFPFFQLPGEIRNQIYELVLKLDHPIQIDIDYSSVHGCNDYEILSDWASADTLCNRSQHCCECPGLMDYCDGDAFCECRLAPNLLRASRRTHPEGVGVLYGNRLYFRDFEIVDVYLRTRRRAGGARERARDLVVDMGESPWEVFMDLLGLELGRGFNYGSWPPEAAAAKAFEVFDAAGRFFEALGEGVVEGDGGGGVVRLRLLLNGYTHPTGAAEEIWWTYPDMIKAAVEGKLKKLAANRDFDVQVVVVEDGDSWLDYRYYYDRAEALGLPITEAVPEWLL